jgi:hypothetical protein
MAPRLFDRQRPFAHGAQPMDRLTRAVSWPPAVFAEPPLTLECSGRSFAEKPKGLQNSARGFNPITLRK